MNIHTNKRYLAALIGAFLAFARVVLAQYADWRHSGTFFILTTPEGANLPASATESNFPLQVRLNSGNFNFAEAQPRGEIPSALASGRPTATPTGRNLRTLPLRATSR